MLIIQNFIYKPSIRLLLTLIIAFAGLLGLSALEGISQITQASAPTDFQTETIIGSGLNGPSGFEFAPDGRLFILERTGAVKIYQDGVLLDQPFVTLPSIASGDRGLIGIAFDPDFAQNHFVYFYYTSQDLLNYIVRFDASANIATDNGSVIYSTSSPSYELHVGGSLQFAADGTLFFAVGDNGYPPNAQDLSNPHGKILRINKDGSIPADNPFVGQSGILPEIWAYGLRNPWRFQFDSVTGRLYGGDVGDFTWEEVNLLKPGHNYGWPQAEGVCGCGFVDPIYAYNHDGLSSAVTGGPIYRADQFPVEYYGDLFIGDYARGFIRGLNLNQSDGSVESVYDFDPVAGSVVDLKIGPEGSLYYVTFYPGRLYKISYATDNHTPVVTATADIDKGVAPLNVNFSSAGTYDPDGDELSYYWDFGDGSSSELVNPSKIYNQDGAYTVSLIVSDGENQAESIPLIIQVGLTPLVSISQPLEGATYHAGDTITYNAFATDGAGFDMNDAQISTEIEFHHDTHIHPFEGPFFGRTGSFTIPVIGEASANTWYRIQVTATDDNGLSTTEFRDIFPETSRLTFDTQPSGLLLYLDGVPINTPHSVEGVVGFNRTVTAPGSAVSDGLSYTFSHWLNGGEKTQTVVTPQEDTTYTAVYEPELAFVGEYFNNMALSGLPDLVRLDLGIGFDWGFASPDPEIVADNFSARWTGIGYFNEGDYEFTITADDGVRLYIDGQLVIDEWRDQPPTSYVRTTTLSEGEHTIIMEYYENAVIAVAKLDYVFIPPTPDELHSHPFAAEYWNVSPGPSPLIPDSTSDLMREDLKIDFNWGLGSPDSVINADGFIARWTNHLHLEPGTYEFNTVSDDGIRVYLNGQPVIDQWNDHSATTHSVIMDLEAGTYDIIVEYYENSVDAVAEFNISKLGSEPAPPETGYSAYFWNVGGGFPPTIPTSAAELTRQDDEINFDWGYESPGPEISADNFVARWIGRIDQAGRYEFTVTADDGVRVYLDDILVLDQWLDQPPTTYRFIADAAAGAIIRIEYYEHGVIAVMSFGYILVPDAQSLTATSNLRLDTQPIGLVGTLADISNPDTEVLAMSTDLSVSNRQISGKPTGNDNYHNLMLDKQAAKQNSDSTLTFLQAGFFVGFMSLSVVTMAKIGHLNLRRINLT